MTWVKVCGVTSVEDAQLCVEAGVDAIGLNFWRGTPRRVQATMARAIRESVPSAVEVIALFVDAPLEDIERVRGETGIDWVQLHGSESPDFLRSLLPSAYKALRISGVRSLEELAVYPGERVLLDAAVAGFVGGTGKSFDWSLAEGVIGQRSVIVAGGLRPENVAGAIQQLRPFGVDVASGVESSPGHKDAAKVNAFVRAVRGL